MNNQNYPIGSYSPRYNDAAALAVKPKQHHSCLDIVGKINKLAKLRNSKSK